MQNSDKSTKIKKITSIRHVIHENMLFASIRQTMGNFHTLYEKIIQGLPI